MMKPKLKRPTYLPGIKTVEFPPPGYLTSAQFATRVGTTQMSINRSLRSGKFNTKNLVLAPRNGKATVMINYNTAVIPYLLAMPDKYRPKDFKSRAKEYKHLDDDEWRNINEATKLKKPGPKTIENGEAFVKTGRTPNLEPMDMNRSNLVHKHLQIEKAAIEVKVAKNELVYLADALSVMRMLGTEMRQKWEAFEIKVTPILTTETEPMRIRQILSDYKKEIFDKIRELEESNKFV